MNNVHQRISKLTKKKRALLAQFLDRQSGMHSGDNVSNGGKRLVAYYVARDQELGCSELRRFMLEELPEYMVPWAFQVLDEFPLLPSGKVDLGALPSPEILSGPLEGLILPRTPIEEMLAGIWIEILGVDQLGIHDNFFERGGHSLSAAQVTARVNDAFQVEFSVDSVFRYPTMADLGRIIETRLREETAHQFPSIQRVERNSSIPLSFAQERVWFIDQLMPGNIAYNAYITIRFKGKLNVEALKSTLTEIVRRHEILRTSFSTAAQRPVQQIHSPEPVSLPVLDLSDLPANDREAEAEQLILEHCRKSFDVTQLPLVRWTLLRLGERDHILLQVEHHFLHDGWSLALLLREIKALYEGFSTGKPARLAAPPIQFADFALWQHQWMQGEAACKQLAYWEKKLAGSPPLLELPTDRPRPTKQDFRGREFKQVLPPYLSEGLRSLSRQEGGTLFMTLLAAFNTLLHRYSGQEDILLGSGVANRRLRETEEMLGMVLNSVVFRTDLSGNPSFLELLGRIRDVTLEAYAHQDLPFEKIVDALKPERSLSHNPLYQIMFNFHDSAMPSMEFPDLSGFIEYPHNGSAKFDLNVIVEPRAEVRLGKALKESGETIMVHWEYSTALFDETTIRRMMGHFQTLLEGIVTDPQQPVSTLPLLTVAQRDQLVVQYNQTASEYPRHTTIHELFEQLSEKSPDAVAVSCGGSMLTYRQLNSRANQLAHYLVKMGVGPEVKVGVSMNRSINTVVGMLGILKAGGAYVPLDPDYPKQRLTFMIEDSSAPVLLTQTSLKDRFSEYGGELVCLDTDWSKIAVEGTLNPASGATATNLAYVMYTSGSTGRPKGTCIEHKSVVRLVKNTNYVNLGPEEVFLQFAPISFDASTFELWASLLNGAKLVIFPPHKPSVNELGEFIHKHSITTLWLTAALFHQMVEEHPESLQHVRQLLAGGEALSVPHVKKMIKTLGNRRLINGYGPTENTTFTACHVMTAESRIDRSVSIGKPISNTQVYILDQQLRPVPIGVYGELYIGGDGLAREYLNQPELTTERFIPNPFSEEPGARIYKTGDRVRFLEDGSIEFQGRFDQQVKIRGFRIELGEIEAALAEHPAVREVAVLCREDEPGDKRLVAYIVAAENLSLQADELRHFVQQRVPSYMVPAAFVILSALPLTPNGKVDRNGLPAPERGRSNLSVEMTLPQTEIEKGMAEIWAEILHLENIGINDDFFELGGHSLLASQVINQLRHRFELEIPLSRLFESPTIFSFAKYVDAAIWSAKSAGPESSKFVKQEAGEV